MIRVSSKLLSGVLALGLLGSPALAQETIPTASAAPLGGAPTPPPGSPQALGQRPFYDGADIVRSDVNGCGVPPKEDGSPDKDVHGEVYAGVGTHGYREAGGTACIPIGDHSAATISVDAGRYPGWRSRY
ncbi:MAG TPA: hypothetical protein VH353_13420 [Caulobacteraceae bacterium]|jgi:hypothetical protein|nr:hypothetical protein [Caulobacteraceae bacterium]